MTREASISAYPHCNERSGERLTSVEPGRPPGCACPGELMREVASVTP